MSNLIKSRYVYVKEEEKKIIDSNNRLDELRSLYSMTNKAKVKAGDEAVGEDKVTDSFAPGLHAQVIETAQAIEEITPVDPEQILCEARIEAANLIAASKRESEQECRKAVEEARQKGYEDGLQQAMAEVDIIKNELKAKAEQMDKEYTQTMQNLEPEFAEIVALLVQNITGLYVQDKKDIILFLLHKAMIHADNSKQFLIKVSRDDYELVNADKENLIELISKGSMIEIGIDKSLDKNQCLIETDTGIIDCSLDVELNVLKQDLKLLSLQMK